MIATQGKEHGLVLARNRKKNYSKNTTKPATSFSFHNPKRAMDGDNVHKNDNYINHLLIFVNKMKHNLKLLRRGDGLIYRSILSLCIKAS